MPCIFGALNLLYADSKHNQMRDREKFAPSEVWFSQLVKMLATGTGKNVDAWKDLDGTSEGASKHLPSGIMHRDISIHPDPKYFIEDCDSQGGFRTVHNPFTFIVHSQCRSALYVFSIDMLSVSISRAQYPR